MNAPNSREFACAVAGILDNRLAKDIDILNISNISVIADYFVICSATSSTHVRTLAGHVRETIKKLYEILPQKEEADSKNRWYLLDYGDVVVHIMHHEERSYYAIEKFWSHACRIDQKEWQEKVKELNIPL
ncbi:MAG: ribosome silencing factor [Candidatus Melainabacteria bacterium GWF2_37_15]|nr:MAG: ribosome silencing factor [Candidatus Melainabacteria bacterium GWF2_37_15]